jgi:hypothetical protein
MSCEINNQEELPVAAERMPGIKGMIRKWRGIENKRERRVMVVDEVLSGMSDDFMNGFKQLCRDGTFDRMAKATLAIFLNTTKHEHEKEVKVHFKIHETLTDIERLEGALHSQQMIIDEQAVQEVNQQNHEKQISILKSSLEEALDSIKRIKPYKGNKKIDHSREENKQLMERLEVWEGIDAVNAKILLDEEEAQRVSNCAKWDLVGDMIVNAGSVAGSGCQ